ncbi:bacterio-opsin activator domain-containing protein [Halobium salinum]|uniref:Bacterio-opsin activator domain-containing protein n=1 Tax=Halobium salinum TaxID=1364940 RepID=A0ABD5P9X6_9EURY|nr:bacterio-opsin activator domain-containing protein [Halobium salinum]
MTTRLPHVLVVADRRTGAVVERAFAETAHVERDPAPDELGAADCVVVDHDPPTVDALAVLRTVRERRPTLPVVLFPREGGERLAADALAAGATAYVPRSDDSEADAERLDSRVAALPDWPAADGSDTDSPADGPDTEPPTTAPSNTRPVAGGARPVADGVGAGADAFLKERALAEAPVGITIAEATADRPLIYVNENFERMTGYSASEALGRNCKFMQGPDSSEEAIQEMRDALNAGREVEVEIVNYHRDGTPFWNEVTIAPVHDADENLTHFVGFQTDVTKRKEAEFALEAEREHLEHLLDRMNGLLGDVTDTLVAAASREEVERAVCDRVAATDPYGFAWLVAPDRADETFRTRASAGRPDAGTAAAENASASTGGAVVSELSVPDTEASPLRQALESREVVVAEVDDLPPGQVPAPVAGYETVAAVPLAYRKTTYGVLAVYADGAFDERDTAVLAALGRAVATALNALESKRVLTADNVGELELTLRDPSLFFVDVSERTDCRLEYAGSVYGVEGATSLFFTVSGAPPAEVVALLEASPDVASASVLAERDGTGTVEVSLDEESIVGLLAEDGARTQAITAEDGEARLRVTLPADADTGAVVDRLRERYPGTEFRSYRERTRPAKTKAEYLASVRDRLTDRQYAALQKAYIGGYFDRPRPVTGDDLAASMGVTRATFHQHLVAAQRKLLGEFFDESG